MWCAWWGLTEEVCGDQGLAGFVEEDELFPQSTVSHGHNLSQGPEARDVEASWGKHLIEEWLLQEWQLLI